MTVRGEVTHILVAPELKEGMTSIVMTTFSGDFLQVNGTVLSVDMSTPDGAPVVAKLTPKHYALSQNYPNPFNPGTTISFALPVAGNYTLTIYNVNGQVVNEVTGSLEAGVHEYYWDASRVASGMYLYKLTSGAFSATKKMVLLK